MGSRKLRPSLKNYLSTGKVVTEEPEKPEKIAVAEKASPAAETIAEAAFSAPAAAAVEEVPAAGASMTETDAAEAAGEAKKAQKAENDEPTEPANPTKNPGVDLEKFLGLFSDEDFDTWGPVFKSGARIKLERDDLVELRNFFRTMDRSRFTLYVLESGKAALRTIRSGVQIREPFLLFLLWDDMGEASLYVADSNENLIL